MMTAELQEVCAQAGFGRSFAASEKTPWHEGPDTRKQPKVKAALAAAKEKDATWVRPLLEAYAGRKRMPWRGDADHAGFDESVGREQTFLDALSTPTSVT